MRKEDLRELVYNSDVITLMQDGIYKAIAGFTTFEEILKLIELDDEKNDRSGALKGVISQHQQNAINEIREKAVPQNDNTSQNVNNQNFN